MNDFRDLKVERIRSGDRIFHLKQQKVNIDKIAVRAVIVCVFVCLKERVRGWELVNTGNPQRCGREIERRLENIRKTSIERK